MSSLIETAEQLLCEFREKIALAKQLHELPMQQSEAALPVCRNYLQLLKRTLRKYRNISREQEIRFFKEIKPKFVSETIFNVKVYRLHYSWPAGDSSVQEAYLREANHQINKFLTRNHPFYCYYRNNCSFLDSIYFLRGQADAEIPAGHMLIDTDPAFNTSRDMLLGKLIAYIRFQEYLKEQLYQLLHPGSVTEQSNTKQALVWSLSKSAFLELIYGLHLSRAFNGGNTEIKTMVTILGKYFGVEVKNTYDLFLHIKMRKNDPTKFTNFMRTCLLQKISEDTGPPDFVRDDL